MNDFVRTALKMLATTVGALGLAVFLVPDASAQCGGLVAHSPKHVNWSLDAAQPRLLRMVDEEPLAAPAIAVVEPIVGFWHVKFRAKDDANLPDGFEVDAGYSQWHSDGTEIMNSGKRPPTTGDFCLGVWEKTASRTYKLNHLAAAWDDKSEAVIGPANIREQVTVAADGYHFSGTFTITQYAESGVVLGHVQGIITGTRITAQTKTDPIF